MGAVALPVATILTAANTAVQGYTQYQNAKKQISYTEKMQEYNNKAAARKKAMIQKQEVDKQSDLSRQHRAETGHLNAQMGGLGLSMNSGSPMDLAIENEMTQQIEANRLTGNFNDRHMELKTSLKNANHTLDYQKWQAKQAKQSTLVNSGITLGGMALGGAAAGMWGGDKISASQGVLIGGGFGPTVLALDSLK